MRNDFRGRGRAAVLFDLGNTLAAYYTREQFGPILQCSIQAVLAELRRREIAAPDLETALVAARLENREAPDFRFSAMQGRLQRIFGLEQVREAGLLESLCERFLDPIFAVGRVYDDTLPVLQRLRDAGHATAIVSNAPWGSPPGLWHAELERLGLASAVDAVVMCGDVGWRKPDARVFQFAAARLAVACDACLFVGDEPEWDVAGSRAVGMQAILLDRENRYPEHGGARIRNLHELLT